MYTNWEQIENGTGCPVLDANADGTVPGPVEGECTLGGMASFVVNASSVGDVVETVKFATKYKLRFRIKNVSSSLSVPLNHPQSKTY